MRVRGLERLLAQHGVGVAKLDAVTRKLREAAYLPKAGRGSNAPHIGAKEAALVLIAVAGSTKGTEADARLGKLMGIKSGRQSLADAMTGLLAEPQKLEAVELVRIGRTTRHADLVYANGEVAAFRSAKFDPQRFRVEGVLPSALLRLIADALTEGRATEGQSESRA
jgi:hypothetical protein